MYDPLTFWSAFSFSSKFLVAVSRLVCVWTSSFSNCCIFFSRASTSSLALSFRGQDMRIMRGRLWRKRDEEFEKEAEKRPKLVWMIVSTYVLKGFFFILKSLIGVHEFFLSLIKVILQLLHLFLKISDILFGLFFRENFGDKNINRWQRKHLTCMEKSLTNLQSWKSKIQLFLDGTTKRG